ncbi:MAG: response regulator [Bryobacteraceae bacterium]
MLQAEQELWKSADVARLLSLVESERRYFQEMMASLPVALAVVSWEGAISSTNRAFRKLIGLSLSSALEATVESAGLPELKQALARLEAGEETVVIAGGVGAGSERQDVRMTLQRFLDWDEREAPEALLLVEDISESRRVARQELGAELADVRHRVSKLPVIAWEADLAKHEFTAIQSPDAPPTFAAGADLFAGRVIPDDIARVKKAYESAASFSVDYRVPGSDQVLRDIVRVEENRAFGVTVDITAPALRESAVAQIAKVDALGRLAGKVVHDCNNLLMITSGYGEDLLEGIGEGHPLHGNVQEILTASKRLNELTNTLSAYVKHPSPEKQIFAIDPLVSDLAADLRKDMPADVTLVARCTAGVSVSGDPGLVVHAVKTLVARAAQATAAGGFVTIETSTQEVHFSGAQNHGPAPGTYAKLSIADAGHAIHPDILARLFEPAFGGELASLGLPAIFKSVREMGGMLTAASGYGKGTVFSLLLPCVAAPAATGAPAKEEPVNNHHKTETVLIVEDEAGIRTLMRRILDREGYQLLEAGHGKAALELARNQPGVIDLLVTDVVMPEMNGFELARALRAIRPGLKVLYISGYTGMASFDPAQLSEGSAFLQKPFTLNAFVAKVRALLTEKTA